MTDLIAQHRGRVVNAAGDHLLAEFGSAVMAVQCAVEIQRQIAERNQALERERQMWFRIGINLGDVIVERDDLFGDDVNIAARLQAMAEPGATARLPRCRARTPKRSIVSSNGTASR
jgi:adenylate cyclase